ncbi:OmpA family protein [Flavobacterium sp. SUN046]|uniref:OmpA family protein n=1 Tax=Flavobacterium sp. SUN046 TaxID=3002440 RepID=UPI002DB95B49|nr:OmpA family protein [Flavobacterium sp. SUN046]MEC4050522.1 OmpA family protein [Flavobacterium sp. SUN046]
MKSKLIIALFLLHSLSHFAQEKLELYFDFDQSILNEAAIKKLNTWIASGKDYQVIKVYGFCDWKGTNKYNDTLALKRAMTVYQYLKLHSIDVNKDIQIRSFGEDFEQSEIQGENRRVTLIYQEKKEVVQKTSQQLLDQKVKAAKKGDLIPLPTIYFFNNSARVVPKSEPVLYDLLCVLEENPKLKIEIQGHICCMRPDEPEVISTARAKAIYNFLIQNKIDRNRLRFKGYGVSRPIHPIPEKNSMEEDDNRRVELLVL